MELSRRRIAAWAAATLAAVGLAARAQTIYVATDGSHDVANHFDTWAGAATNIHDAVDLANALGRNVLVSNGVYNTTNVLTISSAFTLEGVNGPAVTTLERDAAFGDFRILTVSNAAAFVAGFTVRNGAGDTSITAAQDAWAIDIRGGIVSNVVVTENIFRANVSTVRVQDGTLTASVVSNNVRGMVRLYANAVVTDTIITANSGQFGSAPAYLDHSTALMDRCRVVGNVSGHDARYAAGIGVRLANGTLRNTLVNANEYADSAVGGVAHSGGVYMTGGTMEHCIVVGNTNHVSNLYGRGVHQTGGTIRNSIIYGNSGSLVAGDYSTTGGTIIHSLAPELTHGVNGNIADDPMFADAAYRLRTGSPCIDAGTNLIAVTHDIDGNTRPQTGGTRGGLFHDMGIHEFNGTAGDLKVGFYGDLPRGGIAPLEVTFRANVAGANTNVTWHGWDFNNDGSYELAGAGLATVTTNLDAGVYSVRVAVSNDAPAVAMSTNLNYISVVGTELYVATNGLHNFPFADAANAATNVHDAIDAAADGCTVHIGPGVFPTAKMILLNKDVTVIGSGADATVLERDATAGNFGIIQMTHADAYVAGLTVRNGNLGDGMGFLIQGGMVSNVAATAMPSGGRAVYVENASFTHGYITNNAGAGIYLGDNAVVTDTLIKGNVRGGDGAPVRINSSSALMDRCRVIGNYGPDNSGRYMVTMGVRLQNGTLRNTLVSGNYNLDYGVASGGVIINAGTMENCTIVANTNDVNSLVGRGVHQTGGTIRNCIIYDNGGSTVAGDFTTTGGTIVHSLAPELTTGAPDNNLNGNPSFIGGGDYRLTSGSPCVNAGTNQTWMDTAFDLDGETRLVDDIVDMGAYEFNPFTGPFSIGFFGAPPLKGLDTLDVVFQSSASGEERDVDWYGWDFNSDGNYEQSGSGLAAVTNTFGPGLYSVTLRASNSVGDMAVSTLSDYVAVVQSDLYVATNGLHIFPFANQANAATNVHDAIDAAVAGCTVHIGPGIIPTTKLIALADDVTVIGSGPDLTVLERNAAAGDFGIIQITHANAYVAGLTAKGGNLGSGAGLNIQAGGVSNVAVTASSAGRAVYIKNSFFTHGYITNNAGPGIYLGDNAVVTDTLIEGNAHGLDAAPVHINSSSALMDRCRVVANSGNRYSMTMGVRLQNGTLRNTLITRNINTDASGSNRGDISSGGVLITGGTMENCTIVANTNYVTSTGGTGVKQEGGTIRNCIIYDNGGSTVAGDYTTDGNGTITYSLAPELTPDTADENLNGVPEFEGGGDYRLQRGASPCIDTGLNQPWMATATDLQGLPRLLQGRPPASARVDMGAYEAIPPLGSLLMVR